MNIPASWAIANLEDVVEIRDDLRQPVNAEERANRVGPYPYYGATGQVGWIDDYLMDGEYILLGEDGAPFFDPNKDKAYRVIGKAWVNNHAHVLRGKPGILENRFLLHALNNTDYRNYANGTTRLKLTQGAMRRIPLPIAPLEEQRRIVAKIEELFSDLDAAVAALKRAKANLKNYRAAVLKAAVEGKLTTEWRAKNPTEPASKLLERILAERRRKWEADQLAKFTAAGKEPPKNWKAKYVEPKAPDTSGLPEIPSSWVWATLEALADVTGGITKDQKRANQPGMREVPYLRVANVQRGFLDIAEMKFISASEHNIAELRLEPGDVLFTEGGDRDKLGRGWIWSGEIAECIHQNHIFRGRLYSKKMQPQFVSHHGNTFGQEWFTKAGKQTTNLASINLGILRRFPVPVPPAAEQAEAIALLDEKLSQIAAADSAIDHSFFRAHRLRQAILKQAFEGRLVPQDPNDEPASVLLSRMTSGNGEQACRRKSRSARSERLAK